MSLPFLPEEMLMEILVWMDGPTLLQIRKCCTIWHRIATFLFLHDHQVVLPLISSESPPSTISVPPFAHHIHALHGISYPYPFHILLLSVNKQIYALLGTFEPEENRFFSFSPALEVSSDSPDDPLECSSEPRFSEIENVYICEIVNKYSTPHFTTLDKISHGFGRMIPQGYLRYTIFPIPTETVRHRQYFAPFRESILPVDTSSRFDQLTKDLERYSECHYEELVITNHLKHHLPVRFPLGINDI